jgi:hypothetical protein
MICVEFLEKVKVVVVIPSRGEPDVLTAVESLYASNLTGINIMIILVFNASESDSPKIKKQNANTFQEIRVSSKWKTDHIQLHAILENQIPDKKAGVGLSRKLGMDIASQILTDNGNHDGIIICFDADCLAPKGYVEDIYQEIHSQKLDLAAINYQHQTSGLSEHQKIGIWQYELFLRYYSLSLKRSGYPFWHQTIGSCMAVSAGIYRKMGGMNERKAGEDFYFMHKLMPVCHSGTIYKVINQLSPRISDRVPFGTGKAMDAWSQNKTGTLYTYHPDIFNDLKLFLNGLYDTKSIDVWLNIGKDKMKRNLVNNYFITTGSWNIIQAIFHNTTSDYEFRKRFFQWFNGFKVLKFVHWARDNFYMNLPVVATVAELLNTDHIPNNHNSNQSVEPLLNKIREEERR